MPEQLFELFDVKASAFWNDHYTFEKKSEKKIKKLGVTTVEMLLINTVIPFLFVYGKERANEEFCERAINFLSQIPAEQNAITKRWEKLKFLNHSAFTSQALLELKNEYCTKKRCLNCSIGNHFLKS